MTQEPHASVSGVQGAKPSHETCLTVPRFAPLPPGVLSVGNVLASRPLESIVVARRAVPAGQKNLTPRRRRNKPPMDDAEKIDIIRLLREGTGLTAVARLKGRGIDAVKLVAITHEQATGEQIPQLRRVMKPKKH